MSRYAVVVAGGRSTRFGDRDKAVADLAGTPMIRRVADRVADATDRLVVNCRSDQREAIEDAMAGYPNPVRYAEDPEPDEGPTAGIRTGLRAAEAWADDDGTADGRDAAAFVVACDMPFVDPALVAALFDRLDGDGEGDAGDDEGDQGDDGGDSPDAVVPRVDDEWFQTTHAVYRAGAMADACDDALARGDRKVIAPLFELEYETVGADDLAALGVDDRSFENLNTREEFEAAAEAFARR
ncbi:NTP transferase domain-containing protein [Halobaculum sp. WSA2]|uniref:Probable molybdenum cofactor guanylyltransferase n=1 Tax=Halobaculum saliterrae TaxID=2073113 RepID=A0A6B0SM48_9EURY|nr:molybdenum cofactor guanylyltransferase [Halobaculum saliterrae]MXR39954.1 NTP transferase domain-containing protein [Halobaculum saliterrae]